MAEKEKERVQKPTRLSVGIKPQPTSLRGHELSDRVKQIMKKLVLTSIP
jgi:hypothetical protein